MPGPKNSKKAARKGKSRTPIPIATPAAPPPPITPTAEYTPEAENTTELIPEIPGWLQSSPQSVVDINDLWHRAFAAGKEVGFNSGYDAGYSLGYSDGLSEGRAEGLDGPGKYIAIDLEPYHTPRVDAASQTLPITVPTYQDAEILTAPTSTDPMPLSTTDWAAEVSSLPTSPLPSRDISVLRSPTVTQPFGSLKQRHRRTPRPLCTHVTSMPEIPIPECHLAHRRTRTRTRRCRHHFPSSRSAHLDWDTDPRLADLSQALKALGWVRGSFFHSSQSQSATRTSLKRKGEHGVGPEALLRDIT